MPKLSASEISELLSSPIIARLATVDQEGSPYIVPIWQYWDGESMYVIPRGKSRFVDYIKNDPRVAVSCADDIIPEHPRVQLQGEIEIVEGPIPLQGRLLEIATEMAERYAGEAGLVYLRGTMNYPRYLLRLTPTRLTSWKGTWHPRYQETDPGKA